MRRTIILLAALLVPCSPSLGGFGSDDEIVMRGDANSDGTVDGSDVSKINNWLFNGGEAPPCMNQADVNHDGYVDSSDSIYLANWLYNGGPIPPSPGPFGSVCTTTDPYISCKHLPPECSSS